MPARFATSLNSTPSHTLSSFDHAVTQWTSLVIVTWGSARKSSHDHSAPSHKPVQRKRHVFGSNGGTGLAESTGQPRVRCWPGGMRAAISGSFLRNISARRLEARDVLTACRDLRLEVVGGFLFELPREGLGFVEHGARLRVCGVWVAVLRVFHELVGPLHELPDRCRIGPHGADVSAP